MPLSVAVGVSNWPGSADGLTWVGHTPPFTVGNAIGWDGTQFVAGGQDLFALQSIATSPDGATWTVQSDPFDDGISGVAGVNGLAWNGTLWVAVGQNSDNSKTIITSPDGVTWTYRPSPFDTTSGQGQPQAVVWNGAEFMAVGASFVGGPGQVIACTSPDGITWTQVVTAWDLTGGFATGLAWDGSQWIVTGRGDPGGAATVMTSPDDVTWTNRVTPMDNPGGGFSQVYGVAADGAGTIVAVGRDAATVVRLMTSHNSGTTWSSPSLPGTTWAEGRGVAWANGLWAAVGTNSKILTSPDGDTWTAQSTGATLLSAVFLAPIGGWSVGRILVG